MAGQAPKPPLKCNLPYVCSYIFWLKIFEVVCLLVTVVFASQFQLIPSVVYIQIVGALGAVTCLAWMLLYLMNFQARFPDFFPVLMFVYHLLMAVLTIGVCVACGVLWPQFKMSLYPQYVIGTIVSFLASVMFIVDAMLSMLWWRNAVDEISTFPCSPWKPEPTI